MTTSPASDRNLVVGVLALQLDFINRDQLIAAMNAWVADKSADLGRILIDHHALAADQHALLNSLVAAHLARHNGDPAQSLATLTVGKSTREQLEALADPDLTVSVRRVAQKTADTGESTGTFQVGSSTSDGQRFLVEAEITGGLEHPGIVPVYGLGTHQDGRPFYAMRFIQGDNLKQAIDAFHANNALKRDPAQRSLETRKLLRRFTDVCNALEYAHARGVLHRDIKPGNIIIGKYGETLIVDWGLAKALGQADPAAGESSLIPSSASGSAETLPGQVVGTPAYMSPEQARGDIDSLSPAADVYSLGATLYSLLTGKVPFQGQNVNEILAAVREGSFPPPRQLDSTIPAALEAICLKAMATRTEDRYPSCRALAEDIDRWLADEPVTARRDPLRERAWRWLRKHPVISSAAAATVLVGLIAALFGLRRERAYSANLAVQRQRAEDREQQAIDAVKRFRDAVANNPELKNAPSLENLRKTLLQEPLAFFRTLRDRLSADHDTRPEALSRLASAELELGAILNEIGDKQLALHSVDEARAVWERLARANPTNTAYQRNLAGAQYDLASLLRATGAASKAIAALQQARDIRELLTRENPSDATAQAELADCYDAIGKSRSDAGEADAAMEALQQAQEIRQRLVHAHPTALDYQDDLASSHQAIGALFYQTGKPAPALEAYRQAQEILERLVREKPAETRFQLHLAHLQNGIGMVLDTTGKSADALAEYRKSQLALEQLVRDNPSVTALRSDLATSLNSVGAELVHLNQPEQGLVAFGQSREVWRQLTRNNPTVTEFQYRLAILDNNRGIILADTGNMPQAIEAHQEAREILDRLARDYPAIPEYQRALADSLNNLGTSLIEVGQFAIARPAEQQAQVLLEHLLKRSPDSPDFAYLLGSIYHNLARIELGARNYGECLASIRNALCWQRLALQSNPRNPIFRKYFRLHCNMLTLLAQNTNDPALADEARRARTDFEAGDPELVAQDARLDQVLKGQPPTDTAERLALGQRAYDVGRFAAASKLWIDALSLHPELAADRQAQYAYNAACAAALAAASQGVDAPAEEATKLGLRAQAMKCLRHELDAWSRLLPTAPPQLRQTIADLLQNWRQDTDLAPVREEPYLAALPTDERAAWVALWRDISDLKAKALANDSAMPSGAAAFTP